MIAKIPVSIDKFHLKKQMNQTIVIAEFANLELAIDPASLSFVTALLAVVL